MFKIRSGVYRLELITWPTFFRIFWPVYPSLIRHGNGKSHLNGWPAYGVFQCIPIIARYFPNKCYVMLCNYWQIMYKWEISPCWITRGSWWFPRLQLDAHHCHRGRSRLRRRPLPWWKVARVSTFALDPPRDDLDLLMIWMENQGKSTILVESIGHICLFLGGVVKQIQDQQPIFWGMFMRIRNIVVHFLMITAAHTSSLAKE